METPPELTALSSFELELLQAELKSLQHSFDTRLGFELLDDEDNSDGLKKDSKHPLTVLQDTITFLDIVRKLVPDDYKIATNPILLNLMSTLENIKASVKGSTFIYRLTRSPEGSDEEASRSAPSLGRTFIRPAELCRGLHRRSYASDLWARR